MRAPNEELAMRILRRHLPDFVNEMMEAKMRGDVEKYPSMMEKFKEWERALRRRRGLPA